MQVQETGFDNQPAELVMSLDGKVLERKTITLTRQPQFVELTFPAEKSAESARLQLAISGWEWLAAAAGVGDSPRLRPASQSALYAIR